MKFQTRYVLHARKFRRLLEGFMWWNPNKTVVPPSDALTNDNMKMFFVKCWEDGSRPNVEQGRKWLNPRSPRTDSRRSTSGTVSTTTRRSTC